MSDRPQLQSNIGASFDRYRSGSASRSPQAEFKLNDYQWQYRIVLVFAPSQESPAYQQQMQTWQMNAEGVLARDLKLVEVFASGESQADGQLIASTSADCLREQFGVSAEEFAVILVGKDGTEKQRSQTAIDLAMLFGTIDAMPMRQQELRSQQSPP